MYHTEENDYDFQSLTFGTFTLFLQVTNYNDSHLRAELITKHLSC